MFAMLEQYSLRDFQNDRELLAGLIERNVHIKTSVVVEDEFEKGDRKLLNFGHTLGHAIENVYQLLHGHAISIGMMAAASFSEQLSGFTLQEKQRLKLLLEKYELPTAKEFDTAKVWSLLKMDKKRASSEMNFILLQTVGKAVIKPIPLTQLEELIQNL